MDAAVWVAVIGAVPLTLSAAAAWRGTRYNKRTHDQLVHNDGSSMRDAVDRLEVGLGMTQDFIAYQHVRNHDFAQSMSRVEAALAMSKAQHAEDREAQVVANGGS